MVISTCLVEDLGLFLFQKSLSEDVRVFLPFFLCPGQDGEESFYPYTR